MIKIVCSVCEKESLIKPQKLKDKNYCSHACYWESKRTSILKNCFICNKEIKVKPCFLQDKNFCSIKCRSVHFSGENHQNYKKVIDRFCDTCNKKLSHKSATREYVKHCSKSCAMKGSKSPSWKGGVWGYPKDFENKRHNIRKRDEYKCQLCFSQAKGIKSLHVHHIDHNKKNSSDNNLITLCAKCHKRIHVGKIKINDRQGGIIGGFKSPYSL